CMSSRRWASTTTYAVSASNGDGSMQQTVPHSGSPLGVTLLHSLPPSVVTWTSPSSLPAQMRAFCLGDSAMAKTVSYTSTPGLSPVIGPPDHFCLLLSLRVRSGLIAFQVSPPSVVLKTTLAAWYTALLSCGDTTTGAVHWKRYLRSSAPCPDALYG